MKTCMSTYASTKSKNKFSALSSWVCINSSKHTCRIAVVRQGRLIMHVSTRRFPEYPGYERRLGVASYRMALNLGREAKRRGLLTKGGKALSFVLRVKGGQSHAVRGLVRGGFTFWLALEVKNPSFNGCRKKKRRRL